MALLDGLTTYLASLGIGTSGVSLFIGTMPMSPDTCVSLHHRGGDRPIRTMGPHSAPPIADVYTIQAVVRGGTTPLANALQLAIINALDHWSGMAGSTQVLYSELAYPVVDVGRDENGRTMQSVVFNIRAAR